MTAVSSNQPRIVAIIGTRAQTIKMAPLLSLLEASGLSYKLILTGQHQNTIEDLLSEFGIKTERHWLHQRKEIKGLFQATFWIFRVSWKLWADRNCWAAKPSKNTIVLVHGDTISTLLAAVMGRLVGARVAHVEAGLRSKNWFHPFPEELIRVLVSQLTHIAYCPGQWACNNLNNRKIAVVNTDVNTILDALKFAIFDGASAHKGVGDPFAVVSIHRFENLYSKKRMRIIVQTIRKLSEKLLVIMVLHPITEKRLKELNLLSEFDRNPGIVLRPRMTYVPFMNLVSNARLVLSDGGSNQEELSYLNIPTLLMRTATERIEGLDKNVVLSQFDSKKIESFIAAEVPRKGRRTLPKLPETEPARMIVEDLRSRL